MPSESQPLAGAAMRAAEPTAVTREQALGGLATAYRSVTDTVAGLAENDFLRPTRCAGWTVQDLLYHVHCDAVRALVTLATPDDGPTDTDYVTYWRPFAGGPPPSAIGAAQSVRIAAAAHPPGTLVRLWEATSAAAVRAALACPSDSRLATQDHVLALPDLLATFAVEATVHLLDMGLELDPAPRPEIAPLALVRRTLDGLLGAGTARPAWDDHRYALKGTGRLPLTECERAVLGPAAQRFPLFG